MSVYYGCIEFTDSDSTVNRWSCAVENPTVETIEDAVKLEALLLDQFKETASKKGYNVIKCGVISLSKLN